MFEYVGRMGNKNYDKSIGYHELYIILLVELLVKAKYERFGEWVNLVPKNKGWLEKNTPSSKINLFWISLVDFFFSQTVNNPQNNLT